MFQKLAVQCNHTEKVLTLHCYLSTEAQRLTEVKPGIGTIPARLVLLLISVIQSLYFLFKMISLGYHSGKMVMGQSRRTGSGERDGEEMNVSSLVPALYVLGRRRSPHRDG